MGVVATRTGSIISLGAMETISPFVRGEYDTAVFRANKTYVNSVCDL